MACWTILKAIADHRVVFKQILNSWDESFFVNLDIIMHKKKGLIFFPQPTVQELLITAPVISAIRAEQDMSLPDQIEDITGHLAAFSMRHHIQIHVRNRPNPLVEFFWEMPSGNAKGCIIHPALSFYSLLDRGRQAWQRYAIELRGLV